MAQENIVYRHPSRQMAQFLLTGMDHQDNSRPYTSLRMQEKLHQFGQGILRYPPCSPNIARSELNLLHSLQLNCWEDFLKWQRLKRCLMISLIHDYHSSTSCSFKHLLGSMLVIWCSSIGRRFASYKLVHFFQKLSVQSNSLKYT